MPADVHLSRVLLCCARICFIMARGWHVAWCLAAALLLLALQPCAACSDVLVACGRYAQAPASARTFDWRVAGAPSRRHHPCAQLDTAASWRRQGAVQSCCNPLNPCQLPNSRSRVLPRLQDVIQ